MADWLDPPVHFLTWRTYGTWMPGNERGWIDRQRNGYGEPAHAADPFQENIAAVRRARSEFVLSAEQRAKVDEVIQEACEWRGWTLLALNVRTNHVHVVFAGEMGTVDPATVLKARASRVLWDSGAVPRATRIWARGGSHRLLRRAAEVDAAVDYVLNRQ